MRAMVGTSGAVLLGVVASFGGSQVTDPLNCLRQAVALSILTTTVHMTSWWCVLFLLVVLLAQLAFDCVCSTFKCHGSVPHVLSIGLRCMARTLTCATQLFYL